MAKTRIKKASSPKKSGASPRQAGHPVPGLIGPLLQFDLAAETERLRQEDAWTTTLRNAKTLVKYPDLRVVLIALKAGTRMVGHKADGSISIQCLTGKLQTSPASGNCGGTGRALADARTRSAPRR